jgi:hypothetical protein
MPPACRSRLTLALPPSRLRAADTGARLSLPRPFGRLRKSTGLSVRPHPAELRAL